LSIPSGRLGPRLIAASMKWMKWTGRSPVERAAAALPDLRRRCAWRPINRRSTLRRDRAVERNGLTKKFQRLCSHAREVAVVSVRGFAAESAVLSGYLHATWRAFEKHCAGDSARYSPLTASTVASISVIQASSLTPLVSFQLALSDQAGMPGRQDRQDAFVTCYCVEDNAFHPQQPQACAPQSVISVRSVVGSAVAFRIGVSQNGAAGTRAT
jgi:hypothetical protein